VTLDEAMDAEMLADFEGLEVIKWARYLEL